MKKLSLLMGCALVLACAHDSGQSGAKMPGAATSTKSQPPPTADTSNSKEVEAGSNAKMPGSAAVSQAKGPAAAPATPEPVSDGKISLSTAPEAAELWRRGYDALFTTNLDVSQGFFKKALEIDPKFLAATVFLYSITPGTESMHQVEDATKAGAGLPEAERTLLELQNAGKHGDGPAIREKAARLLALAPKDPVAHLAVGLDYFVARKLDDALAEFQKASDLDPRLGAPYLQMSNILDLQGKRDDEVAVLRKWVAARPDDPAALAALAGGLMASSKLDEAADAARKATAMPGAGFDTWAGLAYVDEMRGDWPTARADLAKGRDLAQSGTSRAVLDEQMAFVDLAQHKDADALADLDAMAKDAADGQNPNDVVRSGVDRAVARLAAGKLREAAKAAQEAAESVDKAAVSDVARGYLAREALGVEVWVDAAAKKSAEAAEALARLEKASPDVGKDSFQDDGLAWARGEVAWAKSDVKGAVEQFGKCVPEDDLCRFRLAQAQEKAGDQAAAEATRKAIIDGRRGGKFSLLVRAWLTVPAKSAKRKKVAGK